MSKTWWFQIKTKEAEVISWAGETAAEAESYARMAGYTQVGPTVWKQDPITGKMIHKDGEVVILAESIKPNYHFDSPDYTTWAEEMYGEL